MGSFGRYSWHFLAGTCNFSVLKSACKINPWSRAVTAICARDAVWILDKCMLTFLFCCCCATMPISICACVNSQIVWAVEEARAGLGTTSRRAERLLIQHSSSSDLNMVTASLRLHLCVPNAKCGLLQPGSLSLLYTFHCSEALGHLVV